MVPLNGFVKKSYALEKLFFQSQTGTIFELPAVTYATQSDVRQ